jgi:hypothetical protein
MANNKNPSVGDEYGFTKLTVSELNKLIADKVKSNNQLKDQKKEYVSSVNAVVTENNKQIKAALSARITAEQTQTNQVHEQTVADFLSDKATGT